MHMESRDPRCRACFEPHTVDLPCPHCGYEAAAPQHPLVLPVGTALGSGQFLIGRKLGNGGFGITYLAWDQRLAIRVAVKEFFPRQHVARGPGHAEVVVDPVQQRVFANGLRRFLDEARRVAQFQDQPNIVRVRHFFAERGTGYLVMDYYAGETLAQYAFERPPGPRRMDERESIQLMLPVLDGLQECHEHNLLHRDIKPENIFLARRKDAVVPILLDFGAAREVVGFGSRAPIRTPGFAPWEQYYETGPQGPWTDIYACAATLYVLTTLKLPPDGLERQQQRDMFVPPDRVVPHLSAKFCGAISAALTVDRKKRPQTCDQFAALLKDALGHPESVFGLPTLTPDGKTAPPAPPPPPSPPPRAEPEAPKVVAPPQRVQPKAPAPHAAEHAAPAPPPERRWRPEPRRQFIVDRGGRAVAASRGASPPPQPGPEAAVFVEPPPSPSQRSVASVRNARALPLGFVQRHWFLLVIVYFSFGVFYAALHIGRLDPAGAPVRAVGFLGCLILLVAARYRGLNTRGVVATAVGLGFGALAEAESGFAYFPFCSMFGLLPTLARDCVPAPESVPAPAAVAAAAPAAAAQAAGAVAPAPPGAGSAVYAKLFVRQQQIDREESASVSMPDGQRIEVRLKSRMKNGSMLRLRGAAPRGGDLYVELHVAP